MALPAGVIKRCLAECENSEYIPYRMGAVIFKGSRIFGSGHNDVRSCKIIPNKHKQFKEALHAEQSALMSVRLSSDDAVLKGSSILVMRQNPSGLLSLSKPCPMCHKMLKKFGVKWIYYSDRKGQIVRESV